MTSHSQVSLLLLLVAGSGAQECRVVTGPDGLCAFGHLEPTRGRLRVGTTLQIRINGSTCSSLECIDCDGTRRRVRWKSTAPDIASVDSTGLVRGEKVGHAEIGIESLDGTRNSVLSMQAEVLP